MLLRRILTSTVLIAGIYYVLLFQEPGWFSALVFLFTALALHEFFTLLRHGSMPCFRLAGVAMGLIITLGVALELGQTRSGEILFLVLGCLFLFLIQFSRQDNPQALTGISLTLFGILYVSWFLSFLIKMRYLENGGLWVVYLITTTKCGDIGAYTMGTLFGKNSLIPHVSPKKTVEGFFGALLFSLIASLAFKKYLPVHWSLGHLAVIGVLMGLVGQIGDLSESLMKRSCKTKDSGALLPGMGGILDAVDSVLFTTPIFYFHLTVFK